MFLLYFQPVFGRHNIRPPSLCSQSELQCFAPELRHTLLFSKKRRFFEILNALPFKAAGASLRWQHHIEGCLFIWL